MVRAVDDPTPGAGAAGDGDALHLDGRSARSARTRGAIVDALLDLLEEGDLHPTATRIAERAGISLRLIYHHFGDLESLFGAAARRQSERMAAAASPIDPALPLDERARTFVTERTAMLEWLTPVRRAALLQEPYSEELRAARDEIVSWGTRQVADVFAPELAAVPDDGRPVALAALATTSSWGFWNDLRTSGASVEEAAAVVELALEAVLDRIVAGRGG